MDDTYLMDIDYCSADDISLFGDCTCGDIMCYCDDIEAAVTVNLVMLVRVMGPLLY